MPSAPIVRAAFAELGDNIPLIMKVPCQESRIFFINSSLFQPICWYSNINLNIQLSNSWRREVNTKVTFIFGKIDFTVQLNDKMKDRLRTLGNNIHIHEVDNAGHWLPLTHKESVIEHI